MLYIQAKTVSTSGTGIRAFFIIKGSLGMSLLPYNPSYPLVPEGRDPL